MRGADLQLPLSSNILPSKRKNETIYCICHSRKSAVFFVLCFLNSNWAEEQQSRRSWGEETLKFGEKKKNHEINH